MAERDPGFDWPALMRAGLHELRLSPEVFWALTPCELETMLGRTGRPPALSRARFEAMAAAFPDGAGTMGRDGTDG